MSVFTARRVLAVLECRGSDDAVLARAVEIVTASGGFLTLVVVVPRPAPWLNAGPYCTPRVSPDELRDHAARVLARAVSLVPTEVPLLTALEHGKAGDVIARRVGAACHDLVVRRRGRLRWSLPPRRVPAPVVAVAA